MGSSPKRSKRMLPNNVTAVTAFDMTQKPPKPSEHPKQVAGQQVLYNCTVNLSLLILFLQFFESPEFGDKFHKMINSWRIAAMGMQQNIFGTTWRLGLTQTFCICNLICDDFFKLTNTLGTIQTTKHTVLQQFPRRKATEREKLNKPKKLFPILQLYTFTYFRLIVHVQYTSYTYVFISSFLINLPCKIRLSQVPCLAPLNQVVILMRHGDRTPVREKFGDLVRLVAKKNLGTVSKLGPQSDLISTVGIEFHILGQPKCFFCQCL